MTYGEVGAKLKETKDVNEKIKLIRENLGSIGVFGIINFAGYMDSKDKCEIIRAFGSIIGNFGIVTLAKDMEIGDRKAIITENIDIFDEFDIVELTKDMEKEEKLKFFDTLIGRLTPNAIATLYKDASVDTRVEIIKKYSTVFNAPQIQRLTHGMDEETKVEIVEECFDSLNPFTIAELARGYEKRILEKYGNEMTPYNVVKLAINTDKETRKKIIERYAEDIGESCIVPLASDFDEESRKNIVIKYNAKLSISGMMKLCDNMQYSSKMDILRESIELEGFGLVMLIKDMDLPGIKEAVKLVNDRLSSANLVEIIDNAASEEFSKEMLEEYIDILKPRDIVTIAKNMTLKSKKMVMENYADKLGMDEVVSLATEMDNETRKMVFNKYENELGQEEIIRLAKEMPEKDRNEVIVKYKDKIGTFGIMMLSTNREFIKKEIGINEITRHFSLPSHMTIGMEIESEGSHFFEILNNFNFNGWKAKDDASLRIGAEVVSPILRPNIQSLDDIYIVNKVIKNMGQEISERCGAHIHIGANYLTSRQAYANLFDIWCNTEKILYSICNEENEAPRGGMPRYAKPISPNVQKALEKGGITLNKESDLYCFVENLKQVQSGRYYGLNLLNVNSMKNTIEFRVANGTLDPDLWMDNINLFGGIVATSEELAKIQEKEEINDEERNKLEMLDKIKGNISDKEKLDTLLKIIGVEPEAYIKRFEANMKLMDEDTSRKAAFGKMDGPIDLSKKLTAKDIADMTKDVSALSQQDALESLTRAMENDRERNNTIDR